MKLLCDVCENAVASLVCCADEAALCLACDSRVHAANKLANKHLRVPLLAENCDPPSCDICQDKSSFFFCVEDRALLCRECDESIHSANPLAAKHRRFLLTGIKVGSGTNGNTLQEISSIDQQATSSLADNANPTTRSLTGSQEVVKSARDISNNDGGLNSTWTGSRNPFPPVQGTQSSSPPLPAADGKGFGRYTITKDGTLSMASNNVNDAYRSEAGTSTDKPNGTTISIQRISAGQMAPFVAPVLSSIRASLAREEAPNNRSMKHIESTSIKATKCPVSGNREDSNNKSLMMIDVQTSQHTGSSSISDYLNSSLPGWRLDELLTDLVDVCDSRRSPSPPKDNIEPGFGLQDEQSWFAELDFLEAELSPSQEEGIALVPEMPSPPTHSGLVSSHSKLGCPDAQPPWDFDHLFTGPDHSNEFSVVPDISGHRCSPVTSASPRKGNVNGKRIKLFHYL